MFPLFSEGPGGWCYPGLFYIQDSGRQIIMALGTGFRYTPSMDTEQSYKERLAEDPGDDCFMDYAEYLRINGRHLEALAVCFGGLTSNPSALRGRLVLARIFYDAGYFPFAVREIEDLHRAMPENSAITRLKEVLLQDRASEAPAEPADEEVVAEAFLDVEDLE